MKNNIATIILVILVGMVAFWYLTKSNIDTSYLVTENVTADSVDARYIYNILQQMAQVTLDDSVFANPIFKDLKDNTASFSPQASGRNNPFAPVGNDSSAQQTTQSSSR